MAVCFYILGHIQPTLTNQTEIFSNFPIPSSRMENRPGKDWPGSYVWYPCIRWIAGKFWSSWLAPALAQLNWTELTWSSWLLGDRQGHLSERQDVDVRTTLGGRRGQGGHVCMVLLPVHILEFLQHASKQAQKVKGQANEESAPTWKKRTVWSKISIIM